MEQSPDVPVWFISCDDLEYRCWNEETMDNDVECYDGKWRSTRVTTEE